MVRARCAALLQHSQRSSAWDAGFAVGQQRQRIRQRRSRHDQYEGGTLRHVFLDTIFVKANYTVIMRTHYTDFTGEFVMHCHILDHEDAGMMQNVAIVMPMSKTSCGREPAGIC